MNKKLLSLAAAALLVGGLSLAASPADAATPKKEGHYKHQAKHHVFNCYDYAWESQELKDCLDKAQAKQASAKSSPKKGKHKP